MADETRYAQATPRPHTTPALRDHKIVQLAERWGERHAKTVQSLRDDLRQGAPGAGPDEALLRDVAAVSMAEVQVLLKLELALADKALILAEAPQSCATVGRVLMDVVRTNNAVCRRIRETLHASAVLASHRLMSSGGSNGV